MNALIYFNKNGKEHSFFATEVGIPYDVDGEMYVDFKGGFASLSDDERPTRWIVNRFTDKALATSLDAEHYYKPQ